MRTFALIGALAVATVAAVAARGEDARMLVATVGPGFDIALTHPDGRRVSQLTAGTYTIAVRDRSDIHNFKLANKPDGLRVNIDSGVEFVGDKTFTVDLQPGSYGYACSPHWQTMNGGFTVVGAAPSIVAVRLPASALPRAGRLFSLRGLTVELSTGVRVRPSALRATASISGRRLRAVASTTWRIPRTARGKILAVAVGARYGTASRTQTLRLRVR